MCVAKILLFACLSTLIENMRFYDEFVKILQSTPPPSPTFSAELKFAFCGAKLGYGKYACVKDLTNFMSASDRSSLAHPKNYWWID